MRRLLVAGNWKMHGSLKMTTELIEGVAAKIIAQSPDKQLSYDVMVCPSSPYLAHATSVATESGNVIKIGAQTVSEFEKGAYTGEVSLSMLSELGCDYVLLGHSERREYYGESDIIVSSKFAACLEGDAPIVPVLCVGETLEERESGQTETVVAKQINTVINAIGIEGFGKKFKSSTAQAIIAYEPVWAIGTGETASPEQAQEVHAFIRSLLAEHDEEIAAGVRLLYGGSVKPSNALELFAQEDIDGGLVGGASLDVESFAGICSAAQELAIK